MTNLALIALGAALFAIANRLRGTLGVLRVVPAGLAASCVYLVSQNVWAAIAMFAAFMIGMSWGWTKYIWGLKADLTQEQFSERFDDDDTGIYNGIDFVAERLVPMDEDYFKHAVVGMTLRGLWWWVPVAIVLIAFNITSVPTAILMAVGLSIVFPWIYRAGYLTPEFFEQGYLKRSEIFYGAVYGAVFVAALLCGYGV